MSDTIKYWVRIERVHKNELRVDTSSASIMGYKPVQTEQGAMIEVGAIIGAGVLAMRDDDVLEVKLVMHRKGGE